MPSEDKWISVKDRLPEIPEGRYAIMVLVAEYDKGYAEYCGDNSKGYSVHEVSYGPEGFMDLVIGGKEGSSWMPCMDEITHWMYLPEPPEYKNGI